MVDKVASKAYQVRNNWYGAFCQFVRIKGYQYYEIPEHIRYRYPAPGSVAMEEKSYPHLFKKHWKTPFRDSHFNIRTKDKLVPMEECAMTKLSAMPDLTGTVLEGG